MTLAIGASEFSLVLLLTVVIVVPVAAVAFVRGSRGLEDLGKGRFAIDRDDDLGSGSTGGDSPASGEAEVAEEVRQMLEAADFRSQARGEGRLDVEAEIERLMTGESGSARDEAGERASPAPAEEGDTGAEPFTGADQGIREEVRQLVVANNERRTRRGEQPLDVESEVDRRLEEWG